MESINSNRDDILFVMQISVGGETVAPLEVTESGDAIRLAKEFVTKHSLPNEQVLQLSAKIDDIRNDMLSQQNLSSVHNSLRERRAPMGPNIDTTPSTSRRSDIEDSSVLHEHDVVPDANNPHVPSNMETHNIEDLLSDLMASVGQTNVPVDNIHLTDESESISTLIPQNEDFARTSAPKPLPKESHVSPPSINEMRSNVNNESPEHMKLANIRNEFSQFYHHRSTDIENASNTLKQATFHQMPPPSHRPSTFNVKIKGKKSKKIINKTPRRQTRSAKRNRKSKLIRSEDNNSVHPNTKNKTATKRKKSNSVSKTKSKRKRQDWWNKLYDDADRLSVKKDKQSAVATAKKRKREIEGCTFKPKITESARTLKRDGSKIWKRIVDPMGERRGTRLEQMRRRKKLDDKQKYKKECTFIPEVSAVSQRIARHKERDGLRPSGEGIYNRLYTPTKPSRNKSGRSHSVCQSCSPRKPVKAKPPRRASAPNRGSADPPRYVMLHDLNQKQQQKQKKQRFHPDEDITFKPRICGSKHITIARKSVVNVSEHLFNAHTSCSTLHQKTAVALPPAPHSVIKVSETTQKVLQKMYLKHSDNLYFKLCGFRECDLVSVPFDRVLNEDLFKDMDRLDHMILRSMERYCSRKSKSMLRKKHFGLLYSKLLPKCKNKLPMDVARKVPSSQSINVS